MTDDIIKVPRVYDDRSTTTDFEWDVGVTCPSCEEEGIYKETEDLGARCFCPRQGCLLKFHEPTHAGFQESETEALIEHYNDQPTDTGRIDCTKENKSQPPRPSWALCQGSGDPMYQDEGSNHCYYCGNTVTIRKNRYVAHSKESNNRGRPMMEAGDWVNTRGI